MQAIKAATLADDLDDVQEFVYCDKGACELGQISACASLQHASLPFNHLNSLRGVAALRSLRSLNVSHNNIHSLAGLAGAPQLTMLDVSHNKISALAPLTACGPLRQLRLDHNAITSAGEVLYLAALTGLRCLALRGNAVVAACGSEADARAATLALVPSLQVTRRPPGFDQTLTEEEPTTSAQWQSD